MSARWTRREVRTTDTVRLPAKRLSRSAGRSSVQRPERAAWRTSDRLPLGRPEGVTDNPDRCVPQTRMLLRAQVGRRNGYTPGARVDEVNCRAGRSTCLFFLKRCIEYRQQGNVKRVPGRSRTKSVELNDVKSPGKNVILGLRATIRVGHVVARCATIVVAPHSAYAHHPRGVAPSAGS